VAFVNVVWGFVVQGAGWHGGIGSVRDLAGLGTLLARLLNLLLLSVLFTATTVPVDAAEGLDRLLRPLRRVRVPVHEIGMLLVLSLSFIPIFLQEAQHLTAAHRVKMGVSRWGVRHRLRAVVPLMVPLFLSVLRRSDELTLALDARCFDASRERTSLVPGRFGVAEVAIVVTCVAALLACIGLDAMPNVTRVG
jgi:energy-coupling factor transport system permease protein